MLLGQDVVVLDGPPRVSRGVLDALVRQGGVARAGHKAPFSRLMGGKPTSHNPGMSFFQIVILSVVQGLTELLPVSSSAHVIVVEKLLGLDPSAPAMTLLLVMLHTGTMFAVIVFFWRRWRSTFFPNVRAFWRFAWSVIVATAATGIVGELLIKVVEKTAFRGIPHGQIEDLFSHLELIAPALIVVGILIVIAGVLEKRGIAESQKHSYDFGCKRAGLIGIIQGLCLPFRGFSRSGATISIGMLAGVEKTRSEYFSFALAAVLTPPVVARETWRLVRTEHPGGMSNIASAMMSSLVGAVAAFLAGLVALKWLSRWLETGRWHLFGIYCVVAGIIVAVLYRVGY